MRRRGWEGKGDEGWGFGSGGGWDWDGVEGWTWLMRADIRWGRSRLKVKEGVKRILAGMVGSP